MKVVEKFISINGEGRRAGELAYFVRFQGCNLACTYCDTMWANTEDCPYTEETPERIRDQILSSGIANVTLTGGEPLLQAEIGRLICLLLSSGLRTEIETNGAVDLAPFCGSLRPVFTMDYKLPSSGFEGNMRTGNFALLNTEDTVKFVSGTKQDLERMLEIIREFDLTKRASVYISPVYGEITPADIVEFMKLHCLNDVRLQLQMHKWIWDPEKRGV